MNHSESQIKLWRALFGEMDTEFVTMSRESLIALLDDWIALNESEGQ